MNAKNTVQPPRAEDNPPDERSVRPSLAVTVVSSSEKLLVPCLETLLNQRPMDCDFKVYATWNGPGRGLSRLAPELRERFPDVAMTESFTSGFTPNQNRILSEITADYYLVINDDLIFLPDSIEKPLRYIQRVENSKVGCLSIRLLNADGSLQPSTYSFAGIFRTVLAISGLRSLIPLSPKLFSYAALLGLGRGKSRYWSHSETVEVDTCQGAYMLIRKAALDEVGFLDAKGGEETEWHVRFHKHGWKVLFYHEAEVIHLGGMTVSTDPAAELSFMRSFLNIYYKHMPCWRYAVVRVCFFLTYLGKYAAARVQGASKRQDIARKGLSMIFHWPREVS